VRCLDTKHLLKLDSINLHSNMAEIFQQSINSDNELLNKLQEKMQNKKKGELTKHWLCQNFNRTMEVLQDANLLQTNFV
jgi:3-dehydroquinate synthetase